VQTIVGARKQGSLLGVLDDTCTAPGGRLLRRWLLFPLTDVAQIRRRQDAVEFLVEHATLRAELREKLREVYDLERLAGRVKLGTASPRDLAALRRSLERLPELAQLLSGELSRELAPPELLAPDTRALATLAKIAADVAATIIDEPPPQAAATGTIRPGASAEIDELRVLADGGKDAILQIEVREKERTGIPSLKVRYNRVFGYYLVITRSNLKNVPADYIRKQTLANAERYVTPELAELEAKVLGAEDKLGALEAAAFEALRQRVGAHLPALLAAAERVATLDVAACFAEVAHRSSYVRPLVDDSEALEIEEGRHPVVEQLAAAGHFVPNDCRLDPRGPQILVITGPNMAGKSTFMRQVAQIALLAQIGAFVPARRARLGVVDRIFTRVGAADNLARGESTFMVEMRETAHIMAHATRRSLVVLDEIGRGTSTYDGVSIAFAVAEYIHDAIGAKTLFATHYHELCALATRRPRVKNVSVAVREHKGDVVFLHRVVDGAASRSYGIDVAKLAGLPRSVIARARQILTALEKPDSESPQLDLLASTGAAAAGAKAASPLHAALAEVDPDATTPLAALQILTDLKRLL
jgi:DNA mismatch repair protein MutS